MNRSPYILAVFALLLPCRSLAILGVGDIKLDPAKEAQLLSEYLLKQSVYSETTETQSATQKNQDAEAAMHQMMGDPAAAHLSDPNAPPPTPDDTALFLARQAYVNNLAVNSNTAQYVDWCGKRNVAIAAMNAQLTNLSQSTDGRSLDWNNHAAISAQFNLLSNNFLALSMQEANIAAETRTQQKDAALETLRAERDEARRDQAEKVLAVSGL